MPACGLTSVKRAFFVENFSYQKKSCCFSPVLVRFTLLRVDGQSLGIAGIGHEYLKTLRIEPLNQMKALSLIFNNVAVQNLPTLQHLLQDRTAFLEQVARPHSPNALPQLDQRRLRLLLLRNQHAAFKK